ncbi:MAG: glycogen-binding domain-containing protein [bacterium]
MAKNKKFECKEEDISTKCSSLMSERKKERSFKSSENKEMKDTSVKTKKRGINNGGKLVLFMIDAPHAKQVMLGGDFNNWDYKNALLLEDEKTGLWKKEVTMKPGRYEYKFLVDDKWILDPLNIKKARNTFGSENSVIEI